MFRKTTYQESQNELEFYSFVQFVLEIVQILHLLINIVIALFK